MSHAGHDDAGLDFGHASHSVSPSELSSPDHLHAEDELSPAPFGLDAAAHSAATTAPEQSAHLGASEEIGNPNQYQHYWFFQQHNGYCVPSSVTQVIEAQTGVSLHGYNLVEQEAHRLGIPTGAHGLTLDQARELLNGFDIPSHVVQEPSAEAGVSQLAHYLEQGKNVILSVDASTIWYHSPTTDNPTGGPNHALVVTAINAQTGTVTLSDPGNPHGNEEQVPLNTFLEAWQASHYQMLVTDDQVGGADQHAATTAVVNMEGGGLPGEGIAAGIAHGFEHAAGFVLLPIVVGLGVAGGAAVISELQSPGKPGQPGQPGRPGQPGARPHGGGPRTALA
jgi:hypothetical protein